MVNSMTEKDLDIAIEKCERIMEFDTRTLKNPESENGWIFDKIYDLLQFLQQFQFETDINITTTDAISRQAVIDAIMKMPTVKNENGEKFIHQELTKIRIEILPPAQSEQQWIPASKRLPNESGNYLVTIKYKDGSSDDTDIVGYNSCWREWNDKELYGGNIIAWQSKPKPWKGSGQDDT